MYKYLSQVASSPSIGEPNDAEMNTAVAADLRWHGSSSNGNPISRERYREWSDVAVKQGYSSTWRVAREDGRLLAHIWFVVKDGVATVMVLQTCAYGATKIQVAAMLLEAEILMGDAGAKTACYLTQPAGTAYDDAFDACGYVQQNNLEKIPKGAFVVPLGYGGERVAVRWREIESRITDDRMERAVLCLDRQSSTRSLLLPAPSSGFSPTP